MKAMVTDPKQRGLSVAELLIAMVLLSVATGGLASAAVTYLKTNAVSRDMAAATTLLQDRIERFRATQPNELRSLPRSGSDGTMDAMGSTEGVKFTRTWTVTHDTPALGLSRIEVAVSWQWPEPMSAKGVTYVCRTDTCAGIQ
jgi:Tfp pilus assembly protein PilV